MTRRVALILAAVSVGALAGCDGVVGARMTFDDTETAKVTEVVLTGGASNVTVEADSSATETHIRREIWGGTDPGGSYTLTGGVLTLDGDCGRDCRVDFVVTTPAGTAVKGELRSGDVMLRGIGAVDLKLTSGDVMVENATGPVKVRTTSGDLNVNGGSAINLESNSGNLSVMDVTGPVTAKASSGDLTLKLSAAASVTASVNSGDIDLMVPAGDYRVRAMSGSGDRNIIGITDDPTSDKVLELRTGGGDLTVTGD
ncbi:DUF4097 family beta strand repeat-containing protein [Actinoplanes sichuanensis]|uniref:DUF4097 family beta strand repeat-containing protein n=1 Tax=Actinoplanes sichuanensis TaxID=512349 RepID=A0ABW4A9J1_9ACTN|nr:DUF4097 family beta strand repeat-containing protein [Actinoplanes sichuanensis]